MDPDTAQTLSDILAALVELRQVVYCLGIVVVFGIFSTFGKS